MSKKKITGNDGKTYVMKEKKPFYKKIWFWVVAIVVLAIIGGAFGSDDSGEKSGAKKVDADQEASSSSTNSEDASAETFNIGDTVDVDGYQIRVNDVRYSNEEGYSTPDDGKQFAIINITITNGTKEKVSFNPLDFSLNEDGVSSTTGFTYADGVDTLSSGDLDVGATVTGNLVAQARPESSLKLRYEGNMFLKNKEVDIVIR